MKNLHIEVSLLLERAERLLKYCCKSAGDDDESAYGGKEERKEIKIASLVPERVQLCFY